MPKSALNIKGFQYVIAVLIAVSAGGYVNAQTNDADELDNGKANVDLNFEKTELTQKLESFNSDQEKAYREHRNSLQSTQNSAQPTDEADIEELEYMRKINLVVTINSVKLDLMALEVKLNEATVAMDNVKRLNLTENYRGEKLNELKAKKDFLIKQKELKVKKLELLENGIKVSEDVN